MVAANLTKIGQEYEIESLRKENQMLRSVVEYSMAEQVQSLKTEKQQLKDEVIALRAADSEKDKLIAEKERLISHLSGDIDKLADVKASKLIQEVKADYERQLVNAKSNGSKPVRAENKALKEANQTQKEMYESLLAEFNKSHENEETLKETMESIKDICIETLGIVKQLASSGATPDELAKKIDSGIKSIKKKATKTRIELIAEDKEIIKMLLSGKSESEVADIYYSHLADPQVRRVQLSKRKTTDRYKEAYDELVGN
jgi:DNA-binding CsgD family transcriptional regulator